MNYFELYDIPVSFSPNQDLVKKKFYALSKEFHPDFYVNESEDRQREILNLSTENNKAFQTLSNKNKLVSYVLNLYGEKTEGEKYDLPQEFLMDMMEVNEALMEMEFDFDAEKLTQVKSEVDEIEKKLDNEQDGLFVDFETVADSERKEVLKKIKDIYFRKKYLLRIRESIHTFASR